MRMTRRTLLIGAGAGALGVLLAACTPEPTPSPSPTRSPTLPPDSTVPTPKSSVRSTWSTDPFSRGAASFTPVGVQPGARDALSQSLGDRVHFAGEATDFENPGTIRGATASGERVANVLMNSAVNGERIAVVGAGLAGATVASRLAAAGANITVFEARDRIGGRIGSQVDDSWPIPVQLGAWLVPATDTDTLDRLGELDVATVELNTPGWFSADGEVEPATDESIQNAIITAQTLPTDVSLTDALTEAGVDPAEPALAALLANLTATSGGDPDELSSWFPPALPVDDITAAVGDLGPLVESLLDGVKVSLSSPVTRVAYDDTGVSLRLGTGESLSFDRVVMTVPLGVLQQNGIEFDPALPFGHRGAIADLAMGNIETIWLHFEEQFWDTDAALWHVVGGEVSVRTWINLQPQTGENVLVGIIGGAAAAEFSDLDDADALADAIAALELLVPADASD